MRNAQSILLPSLLMLASIAHAGLGFTRQADSPAVLRIYASQHSCPREYRDLRHGALSYSLIQGLDKSADWNRNGTITARELGGYAKFGIDSIAEGTQEPLVVLEGGDSPVCAEGGKTHVLAVGIDRYASPDLHALKFAVNDAGELAKTLARRCPNAVIHTLTDAQATRTKIVDTLAKIGAESSDHDHIVFFFSDHGWHENPPDLFLIAHDSIPDALETVQTGMILYKINRADGLHPLGYWRGGNANALDRDQRDGSTTSIHRRLAEWPIHQDRTL